ncbi:hypothetical protein ACIBF7_17920 [Nonomuraea sp. NPDC050478]|uniref:hypothetical protein n=1 Tax=Nonomuraea sp. NPDC050478 TaxID=3364365 RepID=UPI0037ACDE6B
MTTMLTSEIAPPPGAVAVAALRARVRDARRRARVALAAALLFPAATQVLAERADGAWAAPLALLSLASFAGALAALAVTQVVWGSRARAARRRERELYAVPPPPPLLPVGRLVMACGWAVVLLLGGTLPGLFGESPLAAVLESAMTALGWAGAGAAVCFAAWWARDLAARVAHRGTPPSDPWDPARLAGNLPGPQAPTSGRTPRHRAGPRLGRVRTVTRRAGVMVAVTGVLGVRGRVWDLDPVVICALVAAGVACAVVTDE